MKARGVVKAFAQSSARALRLKTARGKIAELNAALAKAKEGVSSAEQSIAELKKRLRKEERAIIRNDKKELERVALKRQRKISL